MLIFLQSQEKCDTLFRDLLKVRSSGSLKTFASWSSPEYACCLHIQQQILVQGVSRTPTVRCVPAPTQSGYPCLSLHGGKDQSDRESTISDFKSNVCNVLVATSVAARGLDVKDLVRCVFIFMFICSFLYECWASSGRSPLVEHGTLQSAASSDLAYKKCCTHEWQACNLPSWRHAASALGEQRQEEGWTDGVSPCRCWSSTTMCRTTTRTTSTGWGARGAPAPRAPPSPSSRRPRTAMRPTSSRSAALLTNPAVARLQQLAIGRFACSNECPQHKTVGRGISSAHTTAQDRHSSSGGRDAERRR